MSPLRTQASKLTPGALLLAARQTFRHGVSTAYYRDVVRRRILDTPAIHATGGACEIHALTSAGDWLNLVWALKTFYRQSKRTYALCIHDDGTLEPQHRDALTAHFPGSRIISRPEADEHMHGYLRAHPRCQLFRAHNHLAMKVFDFLAYLSSERLLLVDSDILFFSSPAELLRRIEDPQYEKNSLNKDVGTAYTITPEVARAAGVELLPRINSGLGLIHRRSLDLDLFEQWLDLPGIGSHHWRIEQTLIALCSSRFGMDYLPPEYDVRLTGTNANLPSRHYVGAIRHLMYSEGIAGLVKSGFLRWNGDA